MVKIMHLADLHLDSPFSLRSPSEAERFRTELRGAFTSACLLAKSGGINIVLIAGDLFDSEYVTADTKELLVKTFASCPNIRFFIAAGNHDPYSAGSVYDTVKFPENVHVFGHGMECIRLEDEGVCIYGRSFASRTMETSPLAGVGRLDDGMINILVCHGEMSPLSTNGPISKKEIASSGFDYIALGHIHAPSGLLKEGNTYYSYSGCLVGRSFDETGKHGCMAGFVGKNECDMRFVQIAKRRYEICDIDLSDTHSRTEAIEKIRSEIKAYTADTVVRLILSGQTDVPTVFTADDIGAVCGLEIIDRTSPRDSFTDLEKSSTLKGVFYRMMCDRLHMLDSGSEDYAVTLSALKLGLAALSDRSIADDCTKEE